MAEENEIKINNEKIFENIEQENTNTLQKNGIYLLIDKYQRKHFYEDLMKALSDEQKITLQNEIPNETRQTYLNTIKEKIKSQKVFFQYYDQIVENFINLQNMELGQLTANFENDIRKTNEILSNSYRRLKVFLNLRGYLAKDLTPDVFSQFIKLYLDEMVTDNSEKMKEDIDKIKEKYSKEICIAALIFNEYYYSFIKELPLFL